MHRIKAALVLSGAALVASGICASPAVASTMQPLFTCDSSAFCLFENDNYGGGGIGFHLSLHPPGHVINLAQYNYDNGHNAGNSASSMVNHTGHGATLYDNCPRQGSIYAARPHSVDKTFSNNGFNDKASCLVFD